MTNAGEADFPFIRLRLQILETCNTAIAATGKEVIASRVSRKSDS